MADPKKAFHEQVAAKLIEQLQAGVAPWQKPWAPGEPGAGLPVNATTGNRYRGVNALQLMAQGCDDSRWCTYKQAAAIGAQVRKGEHGTTVQYWKFTDEQTKLDDAGRPVLDAQGKPVKEEVRLERPKVFHASVFNAQQIDNLPALQPRKPHEWTPVERAEHILAASGATIEHAEQDRAFYRSSTDRIHLPHKDQFKSAAGYYATALHELGHWTGHTSRLDRPLGNPFGSEAYAKEELRAEIASMIAGDTLGIGHDPSQHAAYVGSWINALANDPLEIVRAAGDAEKIHDYVMAFEQQQVQQQDQQQTTQAEPEPVQVQEAREIVLATDSGTYYTGAEIEPWTDDARDARVYTEPAEAQAAAAELQTRQAEYLEDSRLALHLRDPENPRVTVPCTPETQAEAAPQQAPTPAETPRANSRSACRHALISGLA